MTIKPLKAGDTIGIAAPASPFDRKLFTKGIHVLEKMGFKPLYRDDIFDQTRYLAGTDARRAEELTDLFLNKKVAAIMFARGGYGSQRVIPLLDIEKISKHKKPVIGFSDVTALLTFLRQKAEVPTFYGPVITQLGMAKTDFTEKALSNALATNGMVGELTDPQVKTIKTGNACGKLVGGCLTLINSSLATPYELNTDDSILFLEDVGEKVYVLDRMLTQLKNAGKLKGVKGVIFGSLVPLKDEPHDVEAMIRDVMNDFDGPVVMNFPSGHVEEFITLPLGIQVSMAASNDRFSINYSSGFSKEAKHK